MEEQGAANIEDDESETYNNTVIDRGLLVTEINELIAVSVRKDGDLFTESVRLANNNGTRAEILYNHHQMHVSYVLKQQLNALRDSIAQLSHERLAARLEDLEFSYGLHFEAVQENEEEENEEEEMDEDEDEEEEEEARID